ncbi:putative Ig domain-containing protein [uncultured Shewanella sp.]|uniref:putative Ig domain-containing protein n=1 Tax=uncultured Shewanella sp. TaxID=173975 RepID=UPI002624432A|nr:putative Ig domain-containing protein [uncultured Shewanella sp.]
MKHFKKLAIATLLSAQYSHAQEHTAQFDTHSLSDNQQKNQQRAIQLGEVKTWHSGTINALNKLSSSGNRVLGWDTSQEYIALFSTETETPALLTEVNLNNLGYEYSNINQVTLINEGTQVLIWGSIKVDTEDNHYQTEPRLSLFSFNDTFNLIEEHSLTINSHYSTMTVFNNHILLSDYNNLTFYIENNQLIEAGTINQNLLPNNIRSFCIDKTSHHIFLAGYGNSWNNQPALSVFKLDETNHQFTHKVSYESDDSYNVLCHDDNNVLIQNYQTITNLAYNTADNTLTEKWQLNTYNDLGDNYDLSNASIYNHTLYFNERDYSPESNIASFTIDDTGLTLLEKTNIYSNDYGNPANLEHILFNNGQLIGLATDLDAIFASTINDNATISSTRLLKDGKFNPPSISNIQYSLLSADGEQLFLLDQNKKNLHLLIKDDSQSYLHAEAIDLSALSANTNLYNSQLLLTEHNQLIIISESSYIVFSINEKNTLSFIHQTNYSDTNYLSFSAQNATFNQENNVLMAFNYNELYFFKLNAQSQFEIITSIENENNDFYNTQLKTLGQYFYTIDNDTITTFIYNDQSNTLSQAAQMAIPYGTRDLLLTENNLYFYNYSSRSIQAYRKQDNGELTLLSLSPLEQNDSDFTLMSPYLAISLNHYNDNINFYHINPKTGIWSFNEKTLPLPSRHSLNFIPSNNRFLKHINLLQDNNNIKEIFQLPIKRAPLIRGQKDKYTFLTESNITLDLLSLFIEEDNDDTLTFKIEGLPQGLSLNEHNHVVGSITQATSGFMTITATDKDGLTTELSLEYDIKASAFNANPSPVIMVNPNQAISLDLMTHFFGEDSTLETNDLIFSLVTSDTLSESSTASNRLTLTDNGLLTGTLVDTGLHSIIITITLDEGVQNILTLDIAVNSAPTVLESSHFTFKASEALSIDLKTLFSDPEGNPLTFDTSSLPSGLSLSDQGIISGAVNQTGHYSFNVKAIDEMALTSETNINLNIGSEGDSGGSLGLLSLLLLPLLNMGRRYKRH